MLKKISIRKFLVSASALLALFLVYLIPKDKTYSLKDTIKQELVYTEKEAITSPIFLQDQNQLLARTKVVVDEKNQTIEAQAKELLEILIKDGTGESKIPSGFTAILPSETKIISMNYQNNLLKVNFSKELLEEVKAEEEEKIIEAIVYTLTSISEIKEIILYIDGDVLTYLPKSKITLPSTLNRNFGINKQYDIKDKKNITRVTIYYISEHNDEFYYVPVTKYMNDEREKIKIIIDELATAPLYNSNLMSFLNQNTKLLATEQTVDRLELDFNQAIFNDIDEKNILEEVIYTISLSVADNYEVKEVVFGVENEEICKSVLKSIE